MPSVPDTCQMRKRDSGRSSSVWFDSRVGGAPLVCGGLYLAGRSDVVFLVMAILPGSLLVCLVRLRHTDGATFAVRDEARKESVTCAYFAVIGE